MVLVRRIFSEGIWSNVRIGVGESMNEADLYIASVSAAGEWSIVHGEAVSYAPPSELFIQGRRMQLTLEQQPISVT